MIRYLTVFFKEKNLPFVQWELTAQDGEMHIISNEVVIEAIKGAPKHEQEAIADIIRTIDFQNGDVNDYLKHLAGALINRGAA
jgi:hypothetical protein